MGIDPEPGVPETSTQSFGLWCGPSSHYNLMAWRTYRTPPLLIREGARQSPVSRRLTDSIVKCYALCAIYYKGYGYTCRSACIDGTHMMAALPPAPWDTCLLKAHVQGTSLDQRQVWAHIRVRNLGRNPKDMWKERSRIPRRQRDRDRKSGVGAPKVAAVHWRSMAGSVPYHHRASLQTSGIDQHNSRRF